MQLYVRRVSSTGKEQPKQSGNDPMEYASSMRILGKYYSRDIHKWTGEDGKEHKCPWHPQMVCSCGKCDKGGLGSGVSDSAESVGSGTTVSAGNGAGSGVTGGVGSIRQARLDEADQDSDSEGSVDSEDSEDSDGGYNTNFSCSGKHYKVRGKVQTFDLHSLLYEIECNRIAEKANEVIDPVMGKGHSNLAESKFHVLTKFRPRDVNLHHLHYEFSTNLGLCQSIMRFLVKSKGSSYIWARDLFAKMGLPEVHGLDDIVTKENVERMRSLERQKTDKAKNSGLPSNRSGNRNSKRGNIYLKILHMD